MYIGAQDFQAFFVDAFRVYLMKCGDDFIDLFPTKPSPPGFICTKIKDLFGLNFCSQNYLADPAIPKPFKSLDCLLNDSLPFWIPLRLRHLFLEQVAVEYGLDFSWLHIG